MYITLVVDFEGVALRIINYTVSCSPLQLRPATFNDTLHLVTA